MECLVQLATIVSPIIGAVSIIIAMLAIKSSSDDAKVLVGNVKKLCICQIDGTIETLQAECFRLESLNNNIELQKKQKDKDYAMSGNFSTFFSNHYERDPYEDSINANKRIQSSLRKRIEELKKQKEIIQNEQ